MMTFNIVFFSILFRFQEHRSKSSFVSVLAAGMPVA
jgi:hypothetical protein